MIVHFVVLNLKYLTVTAALELANQKIFVGGQRLVYALVYTLLLVSRALAVPRGRLTREPGLRSDHGIGLISVSEPGGKD
jgi:hypothetical protein